MNANSRSTFLLDKTLFKAGIKSSGLVKTSARIRDRSSLSGAYEQERVDEDPPPECS